MRTTLATCMLAILLTPALQADPMLPQGDSTIVAFGDSTTAIRPGSIAQVYADILRNELPSYGITGSVLNKGVGGNTTQDAMSRFSSDVLAQNPDLVVMQFGINDSAINVWANPPATESRVSLAQFTSNMTYMTQQLKAAGSEVILMTPNPLRWTPALLDLYGVPPYDPNDPMGFNVTITPYCQAVRDLAAAESVPLIDVYNMFVDYDAVSGQSMDDLLLDGMHPNGSGHRMIGDALISTINDGGGIIIPPVTVKPSADFVHKYEADNLPTIEDTGAGKTNWAFFDHPACDANYQATGGVLSYSTTAYETGGEWFYSNANVPNSAWISEVGAGTSFTAEFSARVTDASGAVPGLHTSFDHGDERIWLTVTPDHVAIGDGNMETQVLHGNIDNATDFHQYRIAYDGTSNTYRVWRDGLLLVKDLASPADTHTKGIAFGDMTSQGFADAEIDYFRWDSSGDYEPVALEPVPLSEKGSGEFMHKYEANDLPTVEDMGAGKTNWVFFDHPSCDANFQANGGVLSYSTTAYTSGGEWFYSDVTVPDSAWAAEVFGGSSFTVEFSAKVTDGTDDVPGLHTIFDNGVERAWLTVDTDHVALGDGYEETNILLTDVDNASAFHTYRLAFDAITRTFQVWRDGEHIGVDLDAPTNTFKRGVSFGDSTSSGFGEAEIDFFRWDATGAYTPSLLPGDADFNGIVDEADAAILAANWLASDASWGMGDFNKDGQVNEIDATILAANWHTAGSTNASVPEPSTLVGLVGLLLAGWCMRRRRV